MTKSELEVPSETAKDRALVVVRAAVAAIPVAGGAALELFNALVTPPLEKRKSEWMEAVASELQRLAQKEALSLEALLENEQFIDAVLEASQAAIRTSNSEKREALKNAVINSALPNPPEGSLQKIYIRLVDELTEWHLRILALFHSPEVWFTQRNRQAPQFAMTSSLKALLEKAFPELVGRREFYDYIAKDLFLKGLLSAEGLHTTMSATGAYQSRSTELGKGFISFVSESNPSDLQPSGPPDGPAAASRRQGRG
jgi:hypothetical protein